MPRKSKSQTKEQTEKKRRVAEARTTRMTPAAGA
jgi:hypothetical protein